MSADRELLELAAKAAGINLWWDGESPKELVHHWSGNPEDGGEERDYPWNPLTDDGDALRLAAKLGMDVCIRPSVAHVYADMPNQDVVTDACYRRAITRAAAEIGRSMA